MTNAVNGNSDPLQDLDLLAQILNPAPVSNGNNDNQNPNAANVLSGDPTNLQQIEASDTQYDNQQAEVLQQNLLQQNVLDENKAKSVPVLRGLRNAGWPKI